MISPPPLRPPTGLRHHPTPGVSDDVDGLIRRAVETFGGHPLVGSRRDGARPCGRKQVWAYLMVESVGRSVGQVADALGVTRRSAERSILAGRRLCRAGAKAVEPRGFSNPDKPSERGPDRPPRNEPRW